MKVDSVLALNMSPQPRVALDTVTTENTMKMECLRLTMEEVIGSVDVPVFPVSFTDSVNFCFFDAFIVFGLILYC